jgi:hypothetical protein
MLHQPIDDKSVNHEQEAEQGLFEPNRGMFMIVPAGGALFLSMLMARIVPVFVTA